MLSGATRRSGPESHHAQVGQPGLGGDARERPGETQLLAGAFQRLWLFVGIGELRESLEKKGKRTLSV